LKSDLRVIISGGGTGGHIFPALSIAAALKKAVPSTEFLFVGATGRMEMEKVPEAGYKIVGLWISGLQRSLKLSNLMFPFKVLASVIKAFRVIRSFRPDVAIGVGGYASGPLLYAANWLGIPSLIQEQNSYPGITNKLLAKKASKICVAYDNLSEYFPKEKIILTGNPVRNDMVDIRGKKEEALQFFGLRNDLPVVLVIGGSQGARSINIAMDHGLKLLSENGLQLIWQCGKPFRGRAEQSAAGFDNVKVNDFIKRMDLAYAAADVIVSRAGASTVSELCIVGKPAIMVPLPTAAEDHQTMNCRSLVEKEAALLVADKDAGELLLTTVISTINDSELKKRLSDNISRLAITDAADRIVGEVLKMVEK
jgi:UDP-N-acetylglucosamine--N-acetylmuramyl-(pentapeptide) pyrophosphoryl-undecaprenol N-acetylglucosamine transferase